MLNCRRTLPSGRHIACAPSSAAISSRHDVIRHIMGERPGPLRHRPKLRGAFDFSDMAAGKTGKRESPQLGFQRNGATRGERTSPRHLALLKVTKLRSRRGRIRGGCPLGTPTAAYDGCASSCRGTS